MRGNIEQAWQNRRKVVSAAIRLKYSLLADNELNAVLDVERKKFYKKVQQGQLPAPLDTSKVLDV
jgi:predicted DNA-binding transcriptional regulator AlpA